MRPAIALLCVVFLSACGPGANERSGGDHQRSAAVEIPLGGLVSDRVSEDDGDATDWKKFTVPRETEVNVFVHWDEKDVDARVELRDRYGELLKKADHKEGDSSDLLTVPLVPGDYYVSIHAEDGGSVYSLETSTGRFVVPAGAPGKMLRPGEAPRPE